MNKKLLITIIVLLIILVIIIGVIIIMFISKGKKPAGGNQSKGLIIDSKLRKPLAILVEQNPWLEVIGSDSPSFVLYEDGFLIYRKYKAELVAVQLTEEELKNLLNRLSIGQDFYNLNDYYDSDVKITDQPTTTIYVTIGDKKKRVSVYGRGEKDPTPFWDLYDKLVSYDNQRARPWLPEKIEVMVWPFEYSQLEPLPWPENWPDIQSPETKKRSDDQYSIYLDVKYFEDLKKLPLKNGQAVLINGKKWAISYRLPFPHEEIPLGNKE